MTKQTQEVYLCRECVSLATTGDSILDQEGKEKKDDETLARLARLGRMVSHVGFMSFMLRSTRWECWGCQEDAVGDASIWEIQGDE